MSSEPEKIRFRLPPRRVRFAEERPGPTAADARALMEQLQARAEELDRREEQLRQREADLGARQTALAQRERQVEEKLERLGALLDNIERQKEEVFAASEEEIVSFSLKIAEKVIQHEIEHGRYKIAEVVKKTLGALREKGCIAVRVNPRDYELARAAVQQMVRRFGTRDINTIPDESIPLASCCIETQAGRVFSEIPGRLEAIERNLLNGGQPAQ